MASGPDPSGRSRFAKLGMAILEELSQACRDVLEMEVPPGLVYNIVKTSSIYKFMRPKQEQILLCAKDCGYKDFDITLLYTLIRNICSTIPLPTNGEWGGNMMPAVEEVTTGDDIERIRLIRNELHAHKASFSISQSEFDDTWSIITDICQRLQTFTKKDYMSGLSNIQGQALEEEHINSFREKLEEDDKNNQNLIEMISSMHKEVLEKISALGESKLESKSEIEDKVDPLERKPTDNELMRVTTHIGSDFHLIGIGLGLTSTAIEQIKFDNQSNGVRTLIFDILISWRRKEGNRATVKKFLDVIKDFRGRVEFEEIEKVFKQCPSIHSKMHV